MKREPAGTLAALFGSFVVILAISSGRWVIVPGEYGNEYANAYGLLGSDLHGATQWFGRATFVIGVLVALLAIPLLAISSRVLCAVFLLLSMTMILAAIGFVLTPAGPLAIGPGAFVFALGAAIVVAAPALLMSAFTGSDDIVGPMVAGKRHGRQLVYERGVLVTIEHWEHGQRIRAEAVGADGLVEKPPPDLDP